MLKLWFWLGGFGFSLWPYGTSGWLLNFISLFNFVSSVDKIDKIMLCLVDLVIFALLSEIFLIALFCSLSLVLSHLDFQSLKVQANRRNGDLFVATAKIKVKLLGDHRHRTYYNWWFLFFTFHQPCFWYFTKPKRLETFLWKLILFVIVKRVSYLILIKKMFSKKDQIFHNITRNKPEQIRWWNIF